jgi:exopolysaccharide biosynthesis polyprenyl glycosylphosphotransferase
MMNTEAIAAVAPQGVGAVVAPQSLRARTAPAAGSAVPTISTGRVDFTYVPAVPGPTPAWLRAVDRIHAAMRTPEPVVADLCVALFGALGAGFSFTVAVLLAGALVGAFHVARVYRYRSPLETQGVLWYPARVATPFVVVMLAAAVAAESFDRSGTVAGRFALLTAAGLVATRMTTWGMLSWARRQVMGMRRTLVVGSGEIARTVVRKLRMYPEVGLIPVGILSPDGRREPGAGIGVGALPADLPSIIRYGRIDHVVLVPEGNHDVGVSECLERCDGLDVGFSMLPPLSDLYIWPGMVTQVGGLPLIPLGKVTRTRSALPGKRVFDVLLGSLLLVMALPVMLATAVAIKLDDRGPLLYRQRRVGQGGRQFAMLKFRSMVVNADQMLEALTDRNVTDGLLFKMTEDPRVTRVGRVIRNLSIDELPQLWNVVRGEMSLVGPRPLPVDPDEFGALDGKRHSVPPGITGYWQIAGGTGLSYREMVKLDLAYIQNWSLWLDLRLLLRTVPALLNRHRYGPC